MKISNRKQTFALNYPRTSGVILLLVGAASLYWSILEPIMQAGYEGAPIKLNGKAGIVGFLFSILALPYLFLGSRFAIFIGSADQRSKTPFYIAGAVVGIVGIVILESLKAYLKSRGYIV